MPGTVKTADELKQAIVLRNGGYSLAAIAEKTGISPSTLSRHFKRHKVSKGELSSEVVTQARQRLLNDGGFTDQLKHEIAAIVVDDVAQFKLLRAAIALNLEELMNDASLPVHYRSRGIAAISTSLKLFQELARRALRFDRLELEPSELPELIIRELTQADIEELHRKQRESADGYADMDLPEDIEVIEESE